MPSEHMMRIFNVDDGENTSSYKIRDSHINIIYGTCATVAATAAKVVSIDNNSGWRLQTSSIAIVRFSYSVPANSTLNVGSTGAKEIYQNGQPINASIISAGDTAMFIYDGSKYLLLAIDRTGSDINDKLSSSLKGAAGGLAELDNAGKVPASQLPGYVDDVMEYAALSQFPVTGESDKIYVAVDTGFEYRWSGTQYIRLNTYDLATQGSSGLMSANDKAVLDTLPFSVVNGKLCITYKKEVEE